MPWNIWNISNFYILLFCKRLRDFRVFIFFLILILLSLFFIKKASESFEEIDSGKIVLDEILAFLPLILFLMTAFFHFFCYLFYLGSLIS